MQQTHIYSPGALWRSKLPFRLDTVQPVKDYTASLLLVNSSKSKPFTPDPLYDINARILNKANCS